MVERTPTNDLPARVAGLLEATAGRIRAMTVDRVANVVTWIAVGIVLVAMAFLVVLWVLVAGFRALGTLVGQELAYAIVGVVLLVAGVILWAKRLPGEAKKQE